MGDAKSGRPSTGLMSGLLRGGPGEVVGMEREGGHEGLAVVRKDGRTSMIGMMEREGGHEGLAVVQKDGGTSMIGIIA